ncbi:phosphatidate cytidylyltransferase [Paenibacillus yanchengensis]|uniref:Phosphatidate cytidylyltransferase n=1 Tax=Paenibacillus yanchengensis TaxID=2035833 RepID=A0ABW4YMV2_9BACL
MKQRIITGVLAGAFFIAMTIIGGNWYATLMILLALIGFFEFARMNGHRWYDGMTVVGFVALLYFVIPWQAWNMTAPSIMLVLWSLVAILLLITVLSKNRYTIDKAALVVLGAIYIGFGFSAMIEVRLLEQHGLLWALLVFGSIWSSDIGAYFTGKAIGKHKLWPDISPNKTIEGAIGGVLLAIVTASLITLFSPEFLAIDRAILIGAIAAVAGQLGDLMQSAYKRVKGIKDTGTLLPGHGGVLDRCDSWIIVFPLLVLTGLIPV